MRTNKIIELIVVLTVYTSVGICIVKSSQNGKSKYYENYYFNNQIFKLNRYSESNTIYNHKGSFIINI